MGNFYIQFLKIWPYTCSKMSFPTPSQKYKWWWYLGSINKPEALKIKMCRHSGCANIHACFPLHKICTITDFQNMQCQT